jgi:hypothetical protein
MLVTLLVAVMHGAVGSLDEWAAIVGGCLLLFSLTFAYVRKKDD